MDRQSSDDVFGTTVDAVKFDPHNFPCFRPRRISRGIHPSEVCDVFSYFQEMFSRRAFTGRVQPPIEGPDFPIRALRYSLEDDFSWFFDAMDDPFLCRDGNHSTVFNFAIS